MTMRDPAPNDSSEFEPKPRRPRRRLLVGTALCSTFLLFQCTKPERDFDALLPGSGGRKGSGGEGGDPGEGVATGGRRNTGGMAGGLGEGGMGGAASGGKGSGGKGSGGKGSGGSGTGGAAPSCAENTDPDCECVDGELVAKDVDGDGEGTRLCEAAPGLDCDDGDEDFVRNECGGCIKDLGGQVGDPCGDCGVLRCQGDSALVCRSPEPQPRRCSDHNTPQLCVNGTWVAQADCGGSLPVCLNGACVQCDPGPPINPVSLSGKRDHKCGSYHSDTVLYQCSDGGYWESTWKLSCYASSHEICNAATASCVTAGLRHPRDKTFEVTPEMLKGVEEKQWGRPVLDVFDSLLGSKFG
jgi:hypothetical protein